MITHVVAVETTPFIQLFMHWIMSLVLPLSKHQLMLYCLIYMLVGLSNIAMIMKIYFQEMRFSTLLINCSFHDATSQAVLNISGQVFVNNCQFTDNEYHYGHGVALSFPAQSTGVQLTIKNCNFISNGSSYFLLQSSTFTKNSATPIYIVQLN